MLREDSVYGRRPSGGRAPPPVRIGTLGGVVAALGTVDSYFWRSQENKMITAMIALLAWFRKGCAAVPSLTRRLRRIVSTSRPYRAVGACYQKHNPKHAMKTIDQ
jgi:hypothetical protein